MSGTRSKWIVLGDHPIYYDFYFQGTEDYFLRFFSQDQSSHNIAPYSITKEYLRSHLQMVSSDSSVQYLEYRSLLMFFSDLLLSAKRCIFHGVAFILHEKAWIFTGPSGSGKTTQYLLWNRLFPDIQIISGDKPVLSFANDCSIMVYPSPWNGKENYFSSCCAPLGGIICLEQSTKNNVNRLSEQDAVIPIFQSVIFTAGNAMDICRVSAFTEKIIQMVPIWRLKNLGDDESSIMMHEVIDRLGDTL